MTLAEFQTALRQITDRMIAAHLNADAAYRRAVEGLMAGAKELAREEPEQFLATARAEAQRLQRIMTEEEGKRR